MTKHLFWPNPTSPLIPQISRIYLKKRTVWKFQLTCDMSYSFQVRGACLPLRRHYHKQKTGNINNPLFHKHICWGFICFFVVYSFHNRKIKQKQRKGIKMSSTADQAGDHHCTERAHCTYSLAVIGSEMVEWRIAVQTTSLEGDWHPFPLLAGRPWSAEKQPPNIPTTTTGCTNFHQFWSKMASAWTAGYYLATRPNNSIYIWSLQ